MYLWMNVIGGNDDGWFKSKIVNNVGVMNEWLSVFGIIMERGKCGWIYSVNRIIICIGVSMLLMIVYKVIKTIDVMIHIIGV